MIVSEAFTSLPDLARALGYVFDVEAIGMPFTPRRRHVQKGRDGQRHGKQAIGHRTPYRNCVPVYSTRTLNGFRSVAVEATASFFASSLSARNLLDNLAPTSLRVRFCGREHVMLLTEVLYVRGGILHAEGLMVPMLKAKGLKMDFEALGR
jgi:hypothetical protein